MAVLGGWAVSYERGTPYLLGRKVGFDLVEDAREVRGGDGLRYRDVPHPLLFRGGLVFKAHRLLYHSTLGSRVIKKRREASASAKREESCIDNLLVRTHFITEMICWTGLAPWEFEFPFPGSLASTFQAAKIIWVLGRRVSGVQGYLAHKKQRPPRTLQ